MRFYSLPPRQVYYPYLLVNMHHRDELRRRKFEHAILDSGVEIFKKRKHLKDYPKSFLWRYVQRAEIASKQNEGKVWVTIPDYCDDICPGKFGDNVQRTLENIEEFISIDGIEWLPVLQCRFLNIFTFYEACERLRKLVGNYPRISMGTVCKTRKHSFIIKCCKTARNFFPKSWIHAFGMTLDVLPKVAEYIDSFDSLACYFPRMKFKEWSKTTGLKPFPNASPFSTSKRAEFFFLSYLEKLRKHNIEWEGFHDSDS